MMGLISGVVAGIVVVLGGVYLLYRWTMARARAEPAVLGDLHLPPSYVRRIVWGRESNFVVPRATDAYGRFWKPGVLTLCRDFEWLKTRSAERQKQWLEYKRYEFARAADAWATDPCFVPYITQFSRLLPVGRGCLLDYRESLEKPSVIYWNGVYWHRVAPDCESFLALLEPWTGRRRQKRRLAALRRPEFDGCATAALEAVAQYDIWDTAVLTWLVFSDQNEPTVVLLPDPRDHRWMQAGRPEWQLRVSLTACPAHARTRYSADRATVTERGAIRKHNPASERPTLGQAVAAASRHFSSGSGGPGLLGLVSAYHLPDNMPATVSRYMVDVRSVEMYLGPRPRIWVSEDLTQVRVS